MSEAQRQQMTKKPSWRVHVPARIISFTDGVYGTFHEDLARCCGDFVVRRADDMYAYQLAVSVDDGAMAVTHVLRGEDLLSSRPSRFGSWKLWDIHRLYIPTSPCSSMNTATVYPKRQHGITIRSLRERGMTAEAILSHLAYAGGLVPERRSYSRDELIRCCDFRKLRTTPIVVVL